MKYAEQLLQEGKTQEARAVLVEYVQRNPSSERGWWLLSFILTDPKQQIDCMERVLRIDPQSTLAQARLEKLQGNGSTLPVVPPFIESVSFDEPKAVSAQPPKQDSKPVAKQEPAPAEKKKSPVLQYTVVAVLVCVVVGVLALVALMLLQSGLPRQSVELLSFTQISLPPTWTPAPTATRIAATQASIQATVPAIVPTLFVLPTSAIPRSQIGPSNGYYAPNFSLNNVNNNVTTSLSDYEGQAVIVFFWATWCQVCKAEMPAVQMIYQAYKDQGLMVLAVDVGENASMARSYRDAHALTFPILDDAGRDAASTYQVTAFPTFFFVDPSGVITSINVGGVGYWGFDKKVKAMLNLP